MLNRKNYTRRDSLHTVITIISTERTTHPQIYYIVTHICTHDTSDRQKCVSVGGLQGKELNKFPRESSCRVPRCRKLWSMWVFFCVYNTASACLRDNITKHCRHEVDYNLISSSTVFLFK